jgi:uncharacterized membrane protein YczE
MDERTERTAVISVHSALLAILLLAGVGIGTVLAWAFGSLILGFIWTGVINGIANVSKRREQSDGTR